LCFLLFKDDLAHLVPAHIELAFEFCDPVLWRMVRGVCGASGIVRQPRFARRNRVQHADARDGVIGHIFIEVVSRIIVWRFNRLNIFIQGRRPLTRVAADEAVEILEP
jgi:hypothetical protein